MSAPSGAGTRRGPAGSPSADIARTRFRRGGPCRRTGRPRPGRPHPGGDGTGDLRRDQLAARSGRAAASLPRHRRPDQRLIRDPTPEPHRRLPAPAISPVTERHPEFVRDECQTVRRGDSQAGFRPGRMQHSRGGVAPGRVSSGTNAKRSGTLAPRPSFIPDECPTGGDRAGGANRVPGGVPG